MKVTWWIVALLAVLNWGCSKKSDSNRREEVHRFHSDRTYHIPPPQPLPLPHYPWDQKLVGGHPPITQEFFRCRGNLLNPKKVNPVEGSSTPVELKDCGGQESHSLPVKDEQEYIPPILITLLNHIQESTQKPVIITCGHQCPQHNNYSESTSEPSTSKHQIGAEVDFYVRGMEHEPQKIVDLLQEYYRQNSDTKEDPSFTNFKRYEKPDTNVSIPPWFNKEIFIKLYQKEEGRDFDNRHPYPYIGIQVRWDREADERVNYTWNKAHRGYWRW